MKRPSPRFSDRELDALLQGLREDVAAPADFRARVMQRLQAEGLVAGPVRPSFVSRLATWASPARLTWGLGLGATAMIVFALVGRSPQSPALSPNAPASSVAAPQLAAVKAPAAAKSQPVLAAKPAAPAQAQSLELQGQAPEAPALGRSDAAPSAASGVQLSSVQPKPTVVVDYPSSPKPLPLDVRSEVRNNVVHASRNEAALILVNLAEAGRLRVEVYDRLGRQVIVLANEDRGIGRQELRWTGATDQGGLAASGIYEVRITAPGVAARHKVLLAK